MADRHGLPIALRIESASPHESKLVDDTIDASFLDEVPRRIIGDKAYDSDKLDAHLLEDCGIEMIAPNIERPNRTTPKQDGRPLRRYCRRWKVERLFAWLYNFRRLTTRWERSAENFLGFLQIACLLILLRHL